MKYVLDASVAARFLLHEELSEKAANVLEDFLRGEIDVLAPSLVIYEVGNALWKAVRFGFIDKAEAASALDTFLKLNVWRNLKESELLDAISLAVEKDITYYDAAYIALAKSERAILLTADEGLIRKASGLVEAVHLKDY